MKKLKILIATIEELQDKVNRLMIENDLLKNEIAELKGEIKSAA